MCNGSATRLASSVLCALLWVGPAGYYDADDMVGLYYPNPHGPMTYCLNTKLARARVRFEASGRPPLLLTSRAAALEIGTRDDGHGVRMYV